MLKVKVIDSDLLPSSVKNWPFPECTNLPCKSTQVPKPNENVNKMTYFVSLWRALEKEYSRNIHQLWVVKSDKDPAVRIEFVKLDEFATCDEVNLVALFY